MTTQDKTTQQGLLSMVGTPIGNLDDASARMVATLSKSDLVLCEDTRVTSKLLNAFNINPKLERCDEHVIEGKIDYVLERLSNGDHISFVSDAGMPGVSDPGQKLVDAALEEGFRVEVVPGPSAITCALVASGFEMNQFYFEGFLPRKPKEKVKRLQLLSSIPGALVFYESPHRTVATLEAIAQVFPKRRVALVRELTKIHEEVVRDFSAELYEAISKRDSIRGECAIVVEPPSAEEIQQRMEALTQSSHEELSLEEAIKNGLEQGRPKTALARRLAKEFKMDRGEVYDLINEIARS